MWQSALRGPADYPRKSDSQPAVPSLKEFITGGTKF
ncbi:hypothetical protein ARTHRO9AX_120017 [Arthrobacter sp. 9AX]|nr:hypothetical protein ARTHRO9AX_120017 [Arthrobacter sp. 9AX]